MSLRAIFLRTLPAFALVFGAASCVVEEIPKTPAATAETVAGTDADSNGVRDDVQAHIQSTYASDDSARAAATRLAKAFQTMLGQLRMVVSQIIIKLLVLILGTLMVCLHNKHKHNKFRNHLKIILKDILIG